MNFINSTSRCGILARHKIMGSLLTWTLAVLFALCSVGSAFAADPYFPGSGTESDPFQIEDEPHLAQLSVLVNDSATHPTYAPAFYILNNDISITRAWTPIGISSSLAFSGAFDGNGKTISDLSIDVTENYQGLFGYILGSSSRNASVKNLTLENVNVNGGQYAGAIVGYVSYANIESCTVDGVVSSDVPLAEIGGIVGHAVNTNIRNNLNKAVVESSEYRAGGIAGYISGGSIVDSNNIGATTSGVRHVGGIVGYATNGFRIEGCDNSSNVTGESQYVGGIAGYAYYNSFIEDCCNTGAVGVTGADVDDIGGIVGYAYTGVDIARCYNGGDVITSGDNAGGIVGTANSTVNVANCLNAGAVTGNGTLGGIAGQATSSSVIEESKNEGFVQGVFDNVGGVAGYLARSTVTNCYSTANVNVPSSTTPYPFGDYVGGIVGESVGGTVLNCYTTGDVYGDDDVGGVTGYLSLSTETACVALGKEVIGTGRESGRVSGYPPYDPSVYRTCYANDSMAPGSGGYDGDDVSLEEAQEEDFWVKIGWSTDIWEFPLGEFPQLRNLPEPCAAGVKDDEA